MKTMMRGSRLNGRTIMLATGMPSEEGGYAMPRFGGWDIDQAIIALARATFAEEGRLVVADGDPSLTLLLAMIAGEYQTQRFAESRAPSEGTDTPLVRIYSRGERSDRDREDEALIERFRLVSIEDDNKVADMPQDSRQSMLIDREDPVALVCIGGGPAVLEQAKSFSRLASHRPIFAIKYAGGAAARIAEDSSLKVEFVDVPIIEQVWSRASDRLKSETFAFDRRRHELERAVIPYPVIMQLVIDRIVNGDKAPGL